MIPSEYCFFCKNYFILYFEGKESASSFIQLSQQYKSAPSANFEVSWPFKDVVIAKVHFCVFYSLSLYNYSKV